MATSELRPFIIWRHASASPVVPLDEHRLNALHEFLQRLANGEYLFEEVDSPCAVHPGAEDSILLANQERYGIQLFTWLSLKSGTVWTSPRMTEESLQKFYEQEFQRLYRGNLKSKSEYYEKQMIRGAKIFKWITERRNIEGWEGKTVFDVGCGAGGILEVFKGHGCTAYGSDIGGEDYLEFGRKKGLTLEQGDITALDKYGRADLIILSHVLEHVPDPIAMLQGLRERLLPTGFLYVEVPGIKNLAAYDHSFIRYVQIPHLYHFSQNTLCAMASLAGFIKVAGDEKVRVLLKPGGDRWIGWDGGEARRILDYLRSEESRHHKKSPFRPMGVRVKRAWNTTKGRAFFLKEWFGV